MKLWYETMLKTIYQILIKYTNMKQEVYIKDEKTSRIRKTNPKINSYTVTIPKELIDLLGLSEKDSIIWKYELKKGKLKLDIDILKGKPEDIE